MDTKFSHSVAAFIIGISIVATGFVVASYFYKVKGLSDVINVTGSAQKTITSDVVKWRMSFSRTVVESQLKNGYSLIKQDSDAVMKYLKDNSVDEKSMTIGSVTVNPVYDNPYGKDGSSEPKQKQYILTQDITIESNDVEKISTVAKNSGVLIQEGVLLNNNPLEYYYSKLSDLKKEMLAEATKNAKERAEEIAKSTDSKIGALRSAAMGVTQITPVNSTDVSDYGSYDTTSLEKQITAIVRASFSLK